MRPNMSELATNTVAAVTELLEEEVLHNPKLSTHNYGAALPELKRIRQIVKDRGLWAPWLHKEWGGMDLSLLDYAHVSEALGHSPFGHYLFNCQAPDVGNMEVLLMFGSDEQKQKYLVPLAAGEIHSCFSMTEPNFAGSNPVNMGTTAVKDGDEWLINGHKWFSTAADGANFAIVMAVTNPDGGPYERASMVIVPTDADGYDHVRKISIMGNAMAGHASHSEIKYHDVRVPLENIIGDENSGFAIAQARLGPGRIHHCMRWIGICEQALHMMCEYSSNRELDPGKPLSSRQTIQNWIAESRAEIDAARLMVMKCAEMIDEHGAYEARNEISTIKFFVAGILQQVLDRAIQVHGALGVTDDTPLAFWYAHERGARIYDGPDEVHKSVVARRILRKYKS